MGWQLERDNTDYREGLCWSRVTHRTGHTVFENWATAPSLKLRIELHKAACGHQWAYTHSQCWELAVELIKDKTNWNKCNERFEIQFKHPVGCEHYAGVRRCGRGVEDAAWQGIIYVGTWLTPCIANMSQDLQYRRPETRKWKCDENLNRCECTFSGYSTPFKEPYLLQHCQQASALHLVVYLLIDAETVILNRRQGLEISTWHFLSFMISSIYTKCDVDLMFKSCKKYDYLHIYGHWRLFMRWNCVSKSEK